MNPASSAGQAASARVSLSLVTALVLWASVAVRLITHAPVNIISWDTFGYYLYLPATFIHHDPGISDAAWVRSAMETYKSSGTLYQISELPNGRWVDKYPMGMAMLWSPFFVAGHITAGATGAPQDGFSMPYQWSLIIASLVYLLAGLLLVRKVLLAFFSEWIAMAVLLLIVLGTNYLHQALHSTGMPHIFLFTLGAGVLWHSLQWHRMQRHRDAMILGALLGLLIVARPSEVVWAMAPLFIGLKDARSWRQHLRSLWSRRKQLYWMAVIAVLVCLPQLAYWKWMTGKWLYMSYNNPGEGFEFLHPYTWEVLFSFRKGWYIYTPIMLVATLGILALHRSVADLRWPVIFFFALNLYIVSSWSCWWYADSFGQRALVQSYALMALPLGAAINWLAERGWLVGVAGSAFVLALVGLNLFQFRQCEAGLIHSSRMTWAAYKAVFGRMSAPDGMSGLLLVDHEQQVFDAAPALLGYRALPLIQVVGCDTLEVEWSRMTSAEHVWVEARDAMPDAELSISMVHDGYPYHERMAALNGASKAMWYLTPEVRRPTDRLRVVRRSGSRGAGRISLAVHEPFPSSPCK